MSDDLFNSIYNKSLDLLSRREHSKKEIKEKLNLRFENKELIDSVLVKLLENNLVNDSRFTESYVSSRKRKGFGPKKIIYELLSKGVNESISEAIIAESDDWEQVAKSTFAKKYKFSPRLSTKMLSGHRALPKNTASNCLRPHK